MPAINEVHKYNYPPEQRTDFEAKGHPGKYLISVVGSGSMWFTGSAYGVGAIIPLSSAVGTASLSGGGTIDVSRLTAGTLYEFSVASISGAANVYILYRNQLIR